MKTKSRKINRLLFLAAPIDFHLERQNYWRSAFLPAPTQVQQVPATTSNVRTPPPPPLGGTRSVPRRHARTHARTQPLPPTAQFVKVITTINTPVASRNGGIIHQGGGGREGRGRGKET